MTHPSMMLCVTLPCLLPTSTPLTACRATQHTLHQAGIAGEHTAQLQRYLQKPYVRCGCAHLLESPPQHPAHQVQVPAGDRIGQHMCSTLANASWHAWTEDFTQRRCTAVLQAPLQELMGARHKEGKASSTRAAAHRMLT
jgi:hypothetical protein